MPTVLQIATYFGVFCIVISCLLIACAFLVALAKISNFTQRQLLDTIGGWNTFLEYRKWYHQRQKDILNGCDCKHGEGKHEPERSKESADK